MEEAPKTNGAPAASLFGNRLITQKILDQKFPLTGMPVQDARLDQEEPDAPDRQ